MQRGLIGAHPHRRHLGVTQFGILNGVKLVGRHGDILGIATVSAMAVIIRGQIDVPAPIGIQIEIQQPSLADA